MAERETKLPKGTDREGRFFFYSLMWDGLKNLKLKMASLTSVGLVWIKKYGSYPPSTCVPTCWFTSGEAAGEYLFL